MSSIVEFNAQMYVSEQLTRQLVNTTQDVAIRCVHVLAEKFNFDADEAIHMLGLNMIKLERKVPVKGTKVAKTTKVAAPKPAFPLPYNCELNNDCCYALRQNNGLYTQCTGIRKGDAQFCKGCASQMQKMGAETPEYGTIQQRMAVGIMEYVDPKGRKPVAYAKIMKKYKIDEAQVLAEAGKFNITINPIHFAAAETEGKRGRPKAEKEPKEKGAKGRPKKSKKVLMIEGDDEDLFAALVAEANEADGEEDVISKKKGHNAGSPKKSDEEKEAERLAKEAEKKEKEAKRLAEKAEKEAKLAAEKAEKEAKKKAEEEARLAKKAAEEAEKQAKKEAAEKAKAEKEAKLAAEKEAKKALAEQKKKPESKSKAAASAEPEEDEEPIRAKKIQFEGKRYLKSEMGIIYDYNKHMNEGDLVVVGKWSESANKIIFDDDEEEEEEYDM